MSTVGSEPEDNAFSGSGCYCEEDQYYEQLLSDSNGEDSFKEEALLPNSAMSKFTESWSPSKLEVGQFNRLSLGPLMEAEKDSSPLSTAQAYMAHLDKLYEKTAMDLAELAKYSDMPIVQENGQRRYGPPRDCTEVPPKGSEVFVGKIPRDLNEKDLVPLFESVGRVYEIRLMMDFSGTNRGYCFVQYFDPDCAKKAVEELNCYEIRPGRRIGVTHSIDNCCLFVGNLPLGKTSEEIMTEISRVTSNVVSVRSHEAQDRKSMFAFVEYKTHKDAASARRKMIPSKIRVFGQDVFVDWAHPTSPVKERNCSKNNLRKNGYHCRPKLPAFETDNSNLALQHESRPTSAMSICSVPYCPPASSFYPMSVPRILTPGLYHPGNNNWNTAPVYSSPPGFHANPPTPVFMGSYPYSEPPTFDTPPYFQQAFRA